MVHSATQVVTQRFYSGKTEDDAILIDDDDDMEEEEEVTDATPESAVSHQHPGMQVFESEEGLRELIRLALPNLQNVTFRRLYTE
jgi:hypothetical protein